MHRNPPKSNGGCFCVHAWSTIVTRSHRKSPFAGVTTAVSDKGDKAAEHRRERRQVRTAIKDDAEALPHPRGFGDPWDAAKDGKRRFDPDREPELLRK